MKHRLKHLKGPSKGLPSQATSSVISPVSRQRQTSFTGLPLSFSQPNINQASGLQITSTHQSVDRLQQQFSHTERSLVMPKIEGSKTGTNRYHKAQQQASFQSRPVSHGGSKAHKLSVYINEKGEHNLPPRGESAINQIHERQSRATNNFIMQGESYLPSGNPTRQQMAPTTTKPHLHYQMAETMPSQSSSHFKTALSGQLGSHQSHVLVKEQKNQNHAAYKTHFRDTLTASVVSVKSAGGQKLLNKNASQLINQKTASNSKINALVPCEPKPMKNRVSSVKTIKKKEVLMTKFLQNESLKDRDVSESELALTIPRPITNNPSVQQINFASPEPLTSTTTMPLQDPYSVKSALTINHANHANLKIEEPVSTLVNSGPQSGEQKDELENVDTEGFESGMPRHASNVMMPVISVLDDNMTPPDGTKQQPNESQPHTLNLNIPLNQNLQMAAQQSAKKLSNMMSENYALSQRKSCKNKPSKKFSATKPNNRNLLNVMSPGATSDRNEEFFFGARTSKKQRSKLVQSGKIGNKEKRQTFDKKSTIFSTVSNAKKLTTCASNYNSTVALNTKKYEDMFESSAMKHKKKFANQISLDNINCQSSEIFASPQVPPSSVGGPSFDPQFAQRKVSLRSQLAMRGNRQADFGQMRVAKVPENHSSLHLKLRSQSTSPVQDQEYCNDKRRQDLKKKNGLLIKNNFSMLSSQRNRKFLAGGSTRHLASFLSPKGQVSVATFRNANETRNLQTMINDNLLIVNSSENPRVTVDHLGIQSDRGSTMKDVGKDSTKMATEHVGSVANTADTYILASQVQGQSQQRQPLTYMTSAPDSQQKTKGTRSPDTVKLQTGSMSMEEDDISSPLRVLQYARGADMLTSLAKLTGYDRRNNQPTVISEGADPRLEETLEDNRREEENCETDDPLARIAQKIEHEVMTPKQRQINQSPYQHEYFSQQREDQLPQCYGQLFPINFRDKVLLKTWCSATDHETACFIEENLTMKIVGVVDRILFKLLKSGDLNQGKPMLYKQSRAARDSDICLLHNKAVVMALDMQLCLSDQLFTKVEAMDLQEDTLEPGWQLNWVIVKLRLGNLEGVINLIESVGEEDSLPDDFQKTLLYARMKSAQAQKLQEEMVKTSILESIGGTQRDEVVQQQQQSDQKNNQTFAVNSNAESPDMKFQAASKIDQSQGIIAFKQGSHMDQDQAKSQEIVSFRLLHSNEKAGQHEGQLQITDQKQSTFTLNQDIHFESPRLGKEKRSSSMAPLSEKRTSAQKIVVQQEDVNVFMPTNISMLKSQNGDLSTPLNEGQTSIIHMGVCKVAVPDPESASEPRRKTEDSNNASPFKRQRKPSYYRSKTIHGSQKSNKNKDEVLSISSGEAGISQQMKQIKTKVNSPFGFQETNETAKYKLDLKFNTTNKQPEESKIATPQPSSSRICDQSSSQNNYQFNKPKKEVSDSNIYQEPLSPASKILIQNKLSERRVTESGEHQQNSGQKIAAASPQSAEQKSLQGKGSLQKQQKGSGQKPVVMNVQEQLEIVSEANEVTDVNRSIIASIHQTPVLKQDESINATLIRQSSGKQPVRSHLNSDVKPQRPTSADVKESPRMVDEAAHVLTFGKDKDERLLMTSAFKVSSVPNHLRKLSDNDVIPFKHDHELQGNVKITIDREDTVHTAGEYQERDGVGSHEPLQYQTKVTHASSVRKRAFQQGQSKSLANFTYTKSRLSKQRQEILTGKAAAERRLDEQQTPDKRLSLGLQTTENDNTLETIEGERSKSGFRHFADVVTASQADRSAEESGAMTSTQKIMQSPRSKKSTISRRSAFANNSAWTMPVDINEDRMREDSLDVIDKQMQYGDQVIKAMHTFKQQLLSKEQRSNSKQQSNQKEKIVTSNPLSGMINKWFQDVERFRNVIGGVRKLKEFIKKLSEEGGTGEIYEIQKKKNNQRPSRYQKALIPRQQQKDDVSAFELTNTKYSRHQSTIYFLLDLYDQKKKKFYQLLQKIEENVQQREEEESRAFTSPHKSQQNVVSHMKSSNSLEENSSDDDDDVDEEEKDLFNETEFSKKKASGDKYKIEQTVSELALSILNSRRNNLTVSNPDQCGDSIELNNQDNTMEQNSVQSIRGPSICSNRGTNDPMIRISIGGHTTSMGQPSHALKVMASGKNLLKANSNSCRDLYRKSSGNGAEISLRETAQPVIKIDRRIVVESSEDKSLAATASMPQDDNTGTNKSKRQGHVSFNMTVQQTQEKVSTRSPSVIKESKRESNEKNENGDGSESDPDFASDTSSEDEKYEKQGEEKEAFRWEPNFTEAEKVELLDLAGEYNILQILGNTRAKERTERTSKLLNQGKLEWWSPEERDIHEVLGIDRAKRRRIKLIMAKLEARMTKNREEAAKKRQLSQRNKDKTTLLKVSKKASFSNKKVAGKAALHNQVPTEDEMKAKKMAEFAMKYKKFKKYLHLSRPKQIEETFNAANRLQNEKTLAELQEIILANLKRQAARKSSTAFLNDLNARTNLLKEETLRKAAAMAKRESGSEDCSSICDASVDLSDIKSENESIYWKQQRGSVEDVDILISKDRLFDEEFHAQFKDNLRQLEMCLEAPEQVMQHFENANGGYTATSHRSRKKQMRETGHN